MFIDVFLKAFELKKNNEAIIWNGDIYYYQDVINKINYFKNELKKNNIQPGTVISIDGSFSPSIIALMFALIENQCIILPIYKTNSSLKNQFYEIAEVEIECFFKNDKLVFNFRDKIVNHNLIKILREKNIRV